MFSNNLYFSEILNILEYSPFIMTIIKLTTLFNNHVKNNNIDKNETMKKIIIFILLLFINIVINIILKNVLQIQRPQETQEYGELQKYGMPSGHVQLTWFIIFYDIKHTDKYITFISLIIAFLSSYQRLKQDYHTILQVIVGGILGSSIGYYYR